ncbi:trace amine-associated receptor 1-like [Acipenser ruthenus]|uniref:trace amine-associated receptor 1-like n=1 Tax=Acipenser ruthenus TaxID=7906 RepID=UPI001560C8D6|nr:trace amine-associated receptor 1-like [Acipenser ruthenus]
MNFSQSGISGSTQFCYESTLGSCPKITFPIIARVPLYLFLGAAITVTVCGNLLVIISIAHFKQLHTPTHFLLLSLAAADFLLGGFVMPPSMIRSVEKCWYFGDLLCKVHTSTDITLSTASLWNMFFISIDRYYAVCHPLRYRNKITVFVTVNMIFISWTLAAVSGFGLIFLELNIQGMEDSSDHLDCVGGCFLVQSAASAITSSLVFFYIPGFVMMSIYLKIFLVARKQARSIRDTAFQRQTAEENKNATSLKREMKAARTLGITMGVFLACWSPFFACFNVDPFINYSTPPILVDVVVWFAYLNSAFNPFIYALFYNWFRKAFRVIIFGKIFQNNSSSIQLLTN